MAQVGSDLALPLALGPRARFCARIRRVSDGIVSGSDYAKLGGRRSRRMRDQKWLAVVVVAVACGACAGTESTSSTAESTDSTEAEKPGAVEKALAKVIPVYREVTIPAGTTLRLDLASSIASDTSKVEDAVRATVREAVVVDGQTVVPMGAALAGVVTDVADSGRVKGRARIAYRFNSMTVGDEQLRHRHGADLTRRAGDEG